MQMHIKGSQRCGTWVHWISIGLAVTSLALATPSRLFADGCCTPGWYGICGGTPIEIDRTEVSPGETFEVTVHWCGNPTSSGYPANKGPRVQLLTSTEEDLDSDHYDLPDGTEAQACGGSGHTLSLTIPTDLNATLHPTLTVKGGLWPNNAGNDWYCESSVQITVRADPDIRVDSNSDGVVDVFSDPNDCADPSGDDCVEDGPRLGQGLLLPVNNNDTNANAILDYREADIAGESNDLRTMVFRFPQGADEGRIRLTIEPAWGASRIRIFDENGVQRLGAPPFNEEGEPIGAPSSEIDVPFDPGVADDWYQWSVEGVDKGIVRVRATYLNAQSEEHGTDVAKAVIYEIRSALPEGGDLTPAGETQIVPADDSSFHFLTSIEFADENDRDLPASTAIGSQVEWTVQNLTGASALAPDQSVASEGGWAHTTVTASTVPGSVFVLRAAVTTLCVQNECFPVPPNYVFEHWSPPIMVIPGEAKTLNAVFKDEAGVEVDPPKYPASGVDRLTMMLEAFDEVGNPVRNATPVTAELLGDGRIDWASMLDPLVTLEGRAQIELIAGLLPDQQGVRAATMGVWVDEAEKFAHISQLPIDITLTPSAPSIEVRAGQPVQITAEVVASDGSEVADGAEIVWITSLGSLGGPQGRQGSVAISVVQGGTSSIQLFTAATNGLGEDVLGADVVGTAQIIAAIGHSQGRTSVAFTPPIG